MNTKYSATEAAPGCATKSMADRYNDHGQSGYNARFLTVRDLIKVDPEFHYNQYGDYEAVKEYISDQLEAFTGDDLIKAWLVIDILGDIFGDCFVVSFGSPDPAVQA
ncbi:MAG: hypothetical protein IKQ67_07275 [Candidatus Methanomethylophilaceae archaeon]|nr:hypothetical protein [Candidatus Methanomethylophilaceae archaeon]